MASKTFYNPIKGTSSENAQKPAYKHNYANPSKSRWAILEEELTLEAELGRGSFGIV